MVPAPLRLQFASPRLNVIVLNEAIIILFTYLWVVPTPCTGQLVVLEAGTVLAAEVTFGSKCDDDREDHSPQHNSYQHRPCPASSAWSRGHS